MQTEGVVERVRRALEQEPRIDLEKFPLRLYLDRGDLVVEGEVEDVAAQKLALELAAATPGVDRIIDRLHVEPDRRVPDEALRDSVARVLFAEPELSRIDLELQRGTPLDPRSRCLRAGRPDRLGRIALRVDSGVVTLDGDVDSLARKRLAGALCWWVPGVRDVINGLGVEPPEEDNDEEMTDAVKVVLDKDPLVDASGIGVDTAHGVVRLRGSVRDEDERQIAERDAWSVFGVDRVENELTVST